jgi:hypothetical protein
MDTNSDLAIQLMMIVKLSRELTVIGQCCLRYLNDKNTCELVLKYKGLQGRKPQCRLLHHLTNQSRQPSENYSTTQAWIEWATPL